MSGELDSVSRELFDRLSEREDAEIGALNDLYRAALEQTIERVTGDLPRDEEGRLVPDPGALARLRRSFERFGDSEGASLLLEQHVERVASALSRQVEVIGQGWARLGEDPLTDDELALSQLVRASWLDQMGELSRYHHAQLRDAVMRQALARSTPHLLRSEMRRLSRTSAAQADRMHHDALIGYSRSVIDESSKARGFEYFEYRGPDDSANRPFCDKHVGRIYTREEIEKLDNGQTSNVMLGGGGYRCRHHWRPVKREWLDDDVWEEKRPESDEPAFLAVDERAFDEARANELSEWDQDFIDRGIEPTTADVVSMLRSVSVGEQDIFAAMADELEDGAISFAIVPSSEFRRIIQARGIESDPDGLTHHSVSYIPRSKVSAALIVHELTHALLYEERRTGFRPKLKSYVRAGDWDGLYYALLDEEIMAHVTESDVRVGLGLTPLFDDDVSDEDIDAFITKHYGEQFRDYVTDKRARHGP